MRGRYLRNVAPGLPFAAKFIDFKKDEEMWSDFEVIGESTEEREAYEVEKYIMTFCNHPNVTAIRMAINMGEPGIYKHQNSDKEFVQHDRVYLIMDYAENGCLLTYLEKRNSKVRVSERIQLVRDLFSGMN